MWLCNAICVREFVTQRQTSPVRNGRGMYCKIRPFFFFPVLFLLKFIGWSHRFKASEPFSLDGLLFFLKILKSSCFSETGVSFCLFFPFAFECSGVLDGKLPKMSL